MSLLRTLALTLPGQGIVRPGLLSQYQLLKNTIIKDELDTVSDALGPEFTENLLSLEKSGEKWLQNTSNAQPAILATSYIIFQILKKHFNLDLVELPSTRYVMGHSLGEYTAHVINGTIPFPLALKLVLQRGELMEKLVKSRGKTYSMNALLFRPNAFLTLVNKLGEEGILANINAKNQLVVSGEESKVLDAIGRVNQPEKIILKSVKLPVSIPFHNSILVEIEAELYKTLITGNVGEEFVGKLPIISNLTGRPSTGEESVKNTLAVNSKPVQWVKSMDFLVSQEITDVINIGPGEVLTGLNSKFKVKNHSIDSMEQMEALVKYLE